MYKCSTWNSPTSLNGTHLSLRATRIFLGGREREGGEERGGEEGRGRGERQ